MDELAAALDRLAARIRRDLGTLASPARPWVKPRCSPLGPVLDVAIIGGGRSGLAAAFALRRERIDTIQIIDDNPALTEARTVAEECGSLSRIPKDVTGPDLGIPALTFRAWYEARYGGAAWDSLGAVPRADWARYLYWYRETLALPLRDRTRLERIMPLEKGLFRLDLSGEGAPDSGYLLARKIVLATGRQGGGAWHVPDFVTNSLPPGRYSHACAAVDYASKAGQRLAILGGGAAAFANAEMALAAGVAEVHLFLRGPALQRAELSRLMESAGFLGQFAALDDPSKYAVISFLLDHEEPPAAESLSRVAGAQGFYRHLDSPWTRVEDTPIGVQVMTPKGSFLFDFLALDTDLVTDLRLRPELRELAGGIALWRHRYEPPLGLRNPALDDHPYLGANFEFLPRGPEDADRLHGVFAFNHAAIASHGISVSAASGLRFALPKLVQGVARQLFLDDRNAILGDYFAYREEEFVAPWPAS